MPCVALCAYVVGDFCSLGTFFFFFDEQVNIYKKGLEAAKHTGRIRGYQPLKQETRQPNPYLEANFCSLGTLCAF